MAESRTLGGYGDDGELLHTREYLDHCIKTVIGAVGVCGMLRLAHEYFRHHPNPGRYKSYDVIPAGLLIAEGMIRQATDELDDDEDDLENDSFEVDRFTEYGLLLHQLRAE